LQYLFLLFFPASFHLSVRLLTNLPIHSTTHSVLSHYLIFGPIMFTEALIVAIVIVIVVVFAVVVPEFIVIGISVLVTVAEILSLYVEIIISLLFVIFGFTRIGFLFFLIDHAHIDLLFVVFHFIRILFQMTITAKV
jgi:hypothetical protein